MWGIIGGVVGIVGAIVSIIALFLTHRANEFAKQANTLAKEANSAAIAANGLASEANEESRKANQISSRALSATTDQTVYSWRIEFDYNSSTVFLVNDCPSFANDVRAVIHRKNETVIERSIDYLPAFGEISLESNLFRDEIDTSQEGINRINSGGGFFYAGVGKVKIILDVVWTSELGIRRSDKIEQSLTRAKRK